MYSPLPESPNGLPVKFVGRPSYFGNHWRIGFAITECLSEDLRLPLEDYIREKGWMPHTLITREIALELHRKEVDLRLVHDRAFIAALKTLRGCNLVCYCSSADACHADYLFEVANND